MSQFVCPRCGGLPTVRTYEQGKNRRIYLECRPCAIAAVGNNIRQAQQAFLESVELRKVSAAFCAWIHREH